MTRQAKRCRETTIRIVLTSSPMESMQIAKQGKEVLPKKKKTCRKQKSRNLLPLVEKKHRNNVGHPPKKEAFSHSEAGFTDLYHLGLS